MQTAGTCDELPLRTICGAAAISSLPVDHGDGRCRALSGGSVYPDRCAANDAGPVSGHNDRTADWAEDVFPKCWVHGHLIKGGVTGKQKLLVFDFATVSGRA